MTNQPAIEAAVNYWTSELQPPDKRDAFRAHLRLAIATAWEQAVEFHNQHPDWPAHVKIGVDYDPCPILLTALRACGVECQGFMFSAKGLFAGKTFSQLGEGTFFVREGRGDPGRLIYGGSP